MRGELERNITRHNNQQIENPIEVKINYEIYDDVLENQSRRYALNRELFDSFIKEYIYHFDETSFEYTEDDQTSYNDQAEMFTGNITADQYPYIKHILNQTNYPYKFQLWIKTIFSRSHS